MQAQKCITKKKRIHSDFVSFCPSPGLGFIPNNNIHIWEDGIYMVLEELHHERRGEVHGENLFIFCCFIGQQKGRFQAMREKEAPEIKVRGIVYIVGYIGGSKMCRLE